MKAFTEQHSSPVGLGCILLGLWVGRVRESSRDVISWYFFLKHNLDNHYLAS